MLLSFSSLARTRTKKHLNASKPVIWAGDLNVAVDDLDLARPKENRNK